MSDIDPKKKRRYGPEPLPAGEARGHCVSVRLNSAELALLDAKRAGAMMQRGEFLRAAALHKIPKSRVVPELNRTAWAELARLAGNLNQAQHHINAGLADSHSRESICKLQETLDAVRELLLGID